MILSGEFICLFICYYCVFLFFFFFFPHLLSVSSVLSVFVRRIVLYFFFKSFKVWILFWIFSLLRHFNHFTNMILSVWRSKDKKPNVPGFGFCETFAARHATDRTVWCSWHCSQKHACAPSWRTALGPDAALSSAGLLWSHTNLRSNALRNRKQYHVEEWSDQGKILKHYHDHCAWWWVLVWSLMHTAFINVSSFCLFVCPLVSC